MPNLVTENRFIQKGEMTEEFALWVLSDSPVFSFSLSGW